MSEQRPYSADEIADWDRRVRGNRALGVTARWLATVEALTRERDGAIAEGLEQARLLGAGGSREAALQARVRELERERDEATIRAHQVSTAMDHVEAERDELAEALREARRFAAGHHEQQPAHVLLHGLVVDLPEMIDAALAKIGSNDE